MVGWYSFCIIWTEATKVEDFFGPIRELASKIEQISQVLLVGTFASVQSEKRLTSLVLCYWWKAWISTDPIGEGFCWCPMRKQVGQHRQSNEKTDWPAPSVQWESGWPAPSVQWESGWPAPSVQWEIRLASTVGPMKIRLASSICPMSNQDWSTTSIASLLTHFGRWICFMDKTIQE